MIRFHQIDCCPISQILHKIEPVLIEFGSNHFPSYTATHFDERLRIAEDEHDPDGKFFNLMLEYYDYNMTQTPQECYALYDGHAVEMPVYVSGHPSKRPWIEGSYTVNDYHVMFGTKYYPPTSCQPYAFICRTSGDKYIRLPEDPKYYFGTDWHDWAWSDHDSDYGLFCEEQHYYNVGDRWIANSGPKLNGSGPLLENEIYIYERTDRPCVGCDKIDILDCLAECIYSGTPIDCCECGHEKFRTSIMAPQYSMMDTMQSEILRQEKLKDMKSPKMPGKKCEWCDVPCDPPFCPF